MEPQYCRTCLNKNAFISIFDKEKNESYCEKIMKCVSVSIFPEDNFPDKICRDCVDELITAYNFITKCEATDKILRCMDSTIFNNFNDAVKKEEASDEYSAVKSDPSEPIDIRETFDMDHSDDSDTNNKSSIPKLNRSVKKTKSLGPTQCNVCGKVVSCLSALNLHLRRHTGDKPFTCDYCGKRFIDKGGMKRHIQIFHNQRDRKYICDSCGSRFYTKRDLQIHSRRHTGERPHLCPFCPKAFTQHASLIRHKRIHTKDTPFSCDICHKRFNDKSHLQKHFLVHSEERKYACPVCSKCVKSKESLKTHMLTHSNEKKIVCSFCGMVLSTKGNLKLHIQRVHSEKSGHCVICLKAFSDLESHMTKHTGEKPFTCDKCDLSFSTKRSISNHIKFKHLSPSKYKCGIGDCLRSFPRYNMLEYHLLKYHTNHTPYICQHCSRGYFRLSDLSRHLKVSHIDVKMSNPSLPVLPSLKNDI